ncbi:putative long-chain-alcohol O-fatty-acyltransferase 5 [Tasmannia lanceolata]|uniref:putative long-chain-alcohol O-fatty-acyltransferase 5 n=1 Tax=Tasmannia lanceolata TaxID=3420 RepID=UPI0040630FF1
MEEEIKSLIKVWFSVIASLGYCYFLVTKIPAGKTRLLSLLPIFYLFSILPWSFSSIHLRGISSFFLIWLANFKLLLFSFNKGPLSSHQTTFLNFISIASLPIKSKQDPSPNKDTKENPSPQKPIKSTFLKKFDIALKCLVLALIIHLYTYKQHYHSKFLLVLYCIHLYISLELVLAGGAAMARAMVGLELEPQFNEPYLSTSLQDFWGKRWNLMVTSILRPTIYDPIRRISLPTLGKSGAQLAGVGATFAVSGIMHEVMFYYLTKAEPTWEVTWFFVLHGFCTAVEIAVKRRLKTGTCRFPVFVSRVLTIGFVAVTGFWLFFPQIVRIGADDVVVEECSVFLLFVEENCRYIVSWLGSLLGM